jgi:hypothetical protein
LVKLRISDALLQPGVLLQRARQLPRQGLVDALDAFGPGRLRQPRGAYLSFH